MPAIFNPVLLRPETPSQDDAKGSPFPILRFAPTELKLWSCDGREATLTTRYDLGVSHAASEFLMYRGYADAREVPLVQVDDSDAAWCHVYVRGVSSALARSLAKIGYEKDDQLRRTWCASVEKADLREELDRLRGMNCTLGDREWSLCGDDGGRRLAWGQEDVEPWSWWLREHPRVLPYARAQFLDALKDAARSHNVVHIAPRFDLTWFVHENIAAYGCGMVAAKVYCGKVFTYLPVQSWLSCAVQHELVGAVADFFSLGADFTTSKRYAELRW